MVSNVIRIPFFDTEQGYGSFLLELFKLHPWALGVSYDAFREIGKRSASFLVALFDLRYLCPTCARFHISSPLLLL